MKTSEQNSGIKLDETDKKLLNLLQGNSKLTNKQLAHHLNLSTTPVFERIKRLENTGVIERYGAVVNRKKLGKQLVVFCNVSLKQHAHDDIRKFEMEIEKLTEVMECHHIAGMFDYTLKIITDNMDSYHDFVYNKLAAVSNIGNVRSSFVMREIKNSKIIHL